MSSTKTNSTAHCVLLLSIPPICSPPLSLNYISSLPPADVVEAEVLDAEALLRLVEAPQPLTLLGPSLALPALTTPEIPQRGERNKRTKIHSSHTFTVSSFFIYNTLTLTHRPSRTHQPQYGSLADRQDWQSMWSPHSATGRFSTWRGTSINYLWWMQRIPENNTTCLQSGETMRYRNSLLFKQRTRWKALHVRIRCHWFP